MGLVRSGRDGCAEGASLRPTRQQHTITGDRPVLVSFQRHLRRRRSTSSRHRRTIVVTCIYAIPKCRAVAILRASRRWGLLVRGDGRGCAASCASRGGYGGAWARSGCAWVSCFGGRHCCFGSFHGTSWISRLSGRGAVAAAHTCPKTGCATAETDNGVSPANSAAGGAAVDRGRSRAAIQTSGRGTGGLL